MNVNPKGSKFQEIKNLKLINRFKKAILKFVGFFFPKRQLFMISESWRFRQVLCKSCISFLHF